MAAAKCGIDGKICNDVAKYPVCNSGDSNIKRVAIVDSGIEKTVVLLPGEQKLQTPLRNPNDSEITDGFVQTNGKFDLLCRAKDEPNTWFATDQFTALRSLRADTESIIARTKKMIGEKDEDVGNLKDANKKLDTSNKDLSDKVKLFQYLSLALGGVSLAMGIGLLIKIVSGRRSENRTKFDEYIKNLTALRAELAKNDPTVDHESVLSKDGLLRDKLLKHISAIRKHMHDAMGVSNKTIRKLEDAYAKKVGKKDKFAQENARARAVIELYIAARWNISPTRPAEIALEVPTVALLNPKTGKTFLVSQEFAERIDHTELLIFAHEMPEKTLVEARQTATPVAPESSLDAIPADAVTTLPSDILECIDPLVPPPISTPPEVIYQGQLIELAKMIEGDSANINNLLTQSSEIRENLLKFVEQKRSALLGTQKTMFDATVKRLADRANIKADTPEFEVLRATLFIESQIVEKWNKSEDKRKLGSTPISMKQLKTLYGVPVSVTIDFASQAEKELLQEFVTTERARLPQRISIDLPVAARPVEEAARPSVEEAAEIPVAEEAAPPVTMTAEQFKRAKVHLAMQLFRAKWVYSLADMTERERIVATCLDTIKDHPSDYLDAEGNLTAEGISKLETSYTATQQVETAKTVSKARKGRRAPAADGEGRPDVAREARPDVRGEDGRPRTDRGEEAKPRGGKAEERKGREGRGRVK